MILWCNNTERWWPEIPVLISIATATAVMGTVCLDVYRKERATRRFSRRGSRIFKMVFKQSCWFIAAFYVTWVPYFALQYMWSSGKAFSAYGFILFAGTSVPLQGFWNFFVYIRPRYLINGVTASDNTRCSAFRNCLSWRRKSLPSSSVKDERQTEMNCTQR